MRSEAFLRTYRVLEELLEIKYARSTRTTSSVVMEFLRDEDSLPFRESLDLCREVRNLLTHNAEPDGGPIVEPSEGLLRALERVVEAVKQPLLAMTFATPADQLLTAHYGSPALKLMRQMQQRGFSHVPVLDRDRFQGVFSVSTVFCHLADHPGQSLDPRSTVKLFKPYLPVEQHMSERFLFMDPQANYPQVKRAFERDVSSRKRVAAIFLTGDGSPQGQLLGLITPWDVLGKVQNGRTLIQGKGARK